MKQTLARWEPEARSVLRLIVAFVFTLHGFRNLFGMFPTLAGRRGAVPMALDTLPTLVGAIELVGGVLLFLGYFTRPVAAALAAVVASAYLYSAAPAGVWPIRNGGNEVLLYLLTFLYFWAAGPGAWSLDQRRERKS
jgi:putative oxidoreductase